MTVTISGDADTVWGFQVGRYIGSIRNANKKQYARDYFQWQLKGCRGKEPSYACSCMAAQAVRFQIASLYKDTHAQGGISQ